MLASCHILKLPDELLLRVVQYIPPTTPRLVPGSTKEQRPLSDYRSVSLVCRQLNRAATSVIYAHYAHDSTRTSSAPFIATLFRQPRLASLVHSVKEITVARNKFEPFERSAGDTESLIPVIRHLDFPDKDHMVLLCRSGKDCICNVEAALILAMTPNIQTLALHPMVQDTSMTNLPSVASVSWNMLLAIAQGLAFGLAHRFEHLRVLKLNMFGVSATSLSIILLLKSLVHLTLVGYDNEDYESGGIPWECPPKESSVRTIRLDRFEIKVQLIASLISSCRSLEGFALCIPNGLDPHRDISKYSLLIEELHRHQPELLYLEIIDERHMSERKDSEDQIWFDQLKNFQSLRYLAIPLELIGEFISVDAIP